jgi:hypothetical protein
MAEVLDALVSINSLLIALRLLLLPLLVELHLGVLLVLNFSASLPSRPRGVFNSSFVPSPTTFITF